MWQLLISLMSSQPQAGPWFTRNTRNSCFSKMVIAFPLLGQGFFHTAPCLWFYFLVLFGWEEWITGIDREIRRPCDTNPEFHVQFMISAQILLYFQGQQFRGLSPQSQTAPRLVKFYSPSSMDSPLRPALGCPLKVYIWSLHFAVAAILKTTGAVI